MYGMLVLCFGKNENRMSPGCNYGGVYCLMYGILVLCLGYVKVAVFLRKSLFS